MHKNAHTHRELDPTVLHGPALSPWQKRCFFLHFGANEENSAFLPSLCSDRTPGSGAAAMHQGPC